MRSVWLLVLAMIASDAIASVSGDDLAARARSILGADQGVYVEASDGTVLLAQAATKPVHPASVSKIPTTLALLRKLGPDFRFVTKFATGGRVTDGVLEGDLWVDCDGDPSLVDEDALIVAERLAELGVRRIAGTLRVRGTLTFDWQSDVEGLRLRQALSGSVSPSALATVRAFQLESSKGLSDSGGSLPTQWLRFEAPAGQSDVPAAVTGTTPQERVLVIHRSQPLLALAKSLNDYSNNIFKPLADQAGGAAAVETLARSLVPPAMRPEITLGDGAGTDPRNRMSPRIVVSLMRALDKQLQTTGHGLFDILPVAGIDDGTLRHRLDGPEEAGRVVGKTGTFGDYGASALAGAISTTDRGTVYFAILNHNVPVPEARRRQDRFVRVLLANLHSQPWGYQRDARPAIARVEVLKSP